MIGAIQKVVVSFRGLLSRRYLLGYRSQGTLRVVWLGVAKVRTEVEDICDLVEEDRWCRWQREASRSLVAGSE